MKSSTTRIFQALLIVSLTLNLALITAWLVSPAGPLNQFEHDLEQEARPDLGITQDQLQELLSLEEEFYSARHALCRELQEDRQKLLILLETPGATASTVEEQRERILAAQGEMLDVTVERLLAEKEIFDEEQQQLWFKSLRDRVRCRAPMTP